MRRSTRWIVVILLVACCAGFTVADEVQDELDSLVERWVSALNSEDIDTFLGCYWSNAVRITYFPGSSSMTQGMADLRAEEQESFASFDYQSMNLVYDEPVRFFPDDGQPVYVLANSSVGYMDVFEFEERYGQFRIIRQFLVPHPVAE